MYNILCFGDSNTYGYNPENGMRFGKDVRWTGVLQELLGENYRVIEEGCNGRTVKGVPEAEPWKYGWSSLHAILNSQKPVDLVILMLGTNDLKNIFGLSAQEIADAAEKYAAEIKTFLGRKQSKAPQVLLVAPPAMGDMKGSPFAWEFDEDSMRRNKELPPLYEAAAKRTGSLYLNANTIRPSREDSLHLNEDGHRKLAYRISEVIFSIR